MTNKSINTANLTNKAIMVETDQMTWNEATFTWDGASGTWDHPIGMVNKTINTGSITNKSIN